MSDFRMSDDQQPMTVVKTSRSVIENKLLVELENDSGKVAALLTEEDLSDVIAGLDGGIRAGILNREQFLRIKSIHADLLQLRKLAFP